jgi:proteasome lid subunit RPN8/RPN11
MNFFPEIDRWRIPQAALSDSFAEMSRDGASGNEGIALWLGDRRDDRLAIVTHIVFLRGLGIRRSPDNITIEPVLLREVHHAARKEGTVLLGQIHSHGPGYGISLSPVDQRCGIAVPDFLSIVAPNYAQDGFRTLIECGVHIFDRETRHYRRISGTAVVSSLQVVSGMGAKVLTIEK